MEIKPLKEAITRSLPGPAWPLAERLLQGGQVAQIRQAKGETAFRVGDGRGRAFEVFLWDEEGAWECGCPAPGKACIHVAAALLHLEGKGNSISALTPAWWLERRGEGFLRVFLVGMRGEERVDAPSSMPLTGEDEALGRCLRDWKEGEVPPASQERFIRLLAATSSPVWCEGQRVAVRGEAVARVLHVQADSKGWFLSLATPPEVRWVAPGEPDIALLAGNGSGPGQLRPLGWGGLTELQRHQLRDGLHFDASEGGRLATEVLPSLLKRQIRAVGDLSSLPQVVHGDVQLRLEAKPRPPGMEATLRLVYGDPPVAQVVEGQIRPLGGSRTLPQRDLPAEKRLVDLAARTLGMRLGETRLLEGARAAFFLAQAEESLPGVLRGKEKLGAWRIHEGVLAVRLGGEGEGLGFEVEGRKVGLGVVLDAFHRGESLVPLLEGGWVRAPMDLLEKHIALLDALADASSEGKVPLHAQPLLATVGRALGLGVPPDLSPLAHTLSQEGAVPQVPLPVEWVSPLRSYQERGYHWLRLLGDHGLGGVLADDMGLGKTVQMLVALLAFRGEGPALVVCPTSVLFNWQAEARRFAPSLSQVVLHGGDREVRYREAARGDLCFTTYAVLRLDQERLRKMEFGTVVLDEAQAIKNSRSQTAVAARSLVAKRRFALSGTPVENRPAEIWSLMEFLNPGFLGSEETFNLRFGGSGGGSPSALQALKTRLRPFVLRRRKAEVAPELPPRTEWVLRAAMTPGQKEIYDTLLASRGRPLLGQVAAEGMNRHRLSVLALLTRLRQVCCHPALIPGGSESLGSGKVDLFLETLEEVREEGHRALVFSQFTGFLDLLEPLLRQREIDFLRLDGSTRNRREVVSRFQSAEGPPVFLISLKAGGAGLNLTAADHVFHMDPWWNPAVEDQATDRAHRIGQSKPVMAIKMVAEGTVEERILLLQEKKRGVAEAILGQGDPQQVDRLTEEDLAWLLEVGPVSPARASGSPGL